MFPSLKFKFTFIEQDFIFRIEFFLQEKDFRGDLLFESEIEFFCVVFWRHYHAPVFWILWKLRFWSCASLSFIRTKVVWYICSQSGTFKAIFRYYETSYNLHKSRDKNLTWVTDFEKHQIVADWSKSYREENRKTNLKGTKISHGENTKAYKWMNTLFRRLKIRDLLRNESWIMNHKL